MGYYFITISKVDDFFTISKKGKDFLYIRNTGDLTIIYNQAVEKNERAWANSRLHETLLAEYGATEIINYATLTDFRNAEMTRRFLFSDRNNIQKGTVIHISADEGKRLNIFGGSRRNLYILEDEFTVINQHSMGTDVIQYVIQDDIGVMIQKQILTYPNANGPDKQVITYTTNGPILIKCIGSTNITLNNGRMVARPLFQIINFSNLDPRKP